MGVDMGGEGETNVWGSDMGHWKDLGLKYSLLVGTVAAYFWHICNECFLLPRSVQRKVKYVHFTNISSEIFMMK